MERLFAEAGTTRGTTFTTCRYGNVVGSTGSVIPVMQQQWRDQKRVTITDPDMTRFWISIKDAVMIVEAATTADPGCTVVPLPGATDMATVAYAVLSLEGETVVMGLPVEDDLRIKVIGRRPGEKLHEDLISKYELYRTKASRGYYNIYPAGNEDYMHEREGLSSDKAARISVNTFVEMIEDAAYV
jgi:UDP-N-acetylglucosamine 4,6-dehydratase